MDRSSSEYKSVNRQEEVDKINCYSTFRHKPWIKAIFASLLQFILIGFLYNFGLFFDKLQNEFNSTVTLTGWIGSISYCSFMFGTVLSTWTLRRLSQFTVGVMGVLLGSASLIASSFAPTIIYVIVFYGAFFGLSGNVTMIVSNEVVIPLFNDKRRASAMTLVALGATVGNFSMSNLIEYMIEQVGWRWTFRIFAGIIFIIGLWCCSFFILNENTKRKFEENTKKANNSASTGHLLWFPEVWFFSLATLVCYIALVFQYVFMASFFESVGLSNQKSATGITLLAFGDGFSKVLLVFLAPRIPFPLIYCLPVSLLLLAILSVVLTLTTNQLVIFTVALFLGLPRGVYNGLQLPTGLEVFSARRSKTSANIVLVWSGFGNFAGPFIHGSLYDLTGSYYPALYLSAALLFVSSILMLFTPLWQKYFAPDRYMVDYTINKQVANDINKTTQETEGLYLEQKVSVV